MKYLWNEDLQLLDCLFRNGLFFVLFLIFPKLRGTWLPFHNITVWKTCCRWRFYPYQSYRREINETDVKYTCNWQKVWDSSDSLNGNGSSLLIYIRSTIPVISGDFWTRWNAITVRKGREKGQFWGISYFWIEVFLKEVLGLLPYEGTTFIPNLSS